MNDKLVKLFIAKFEKLDDKFEKLEAENKAIIKKINADTKASKVTKAEPVTKKGSINTEYRSEWVITLHAKGGFSTLHRFKSILAQSERDAVAQFNKYKNSRSKFKVSDDNSHMVLTYASYQGNYPKQSDYIELDRF